MLRTCDKQQDNEARFVSIGENLGQLSHRVRMLEKRIDTLDTVWWKRIWFWLLGYRWYTVGRWYWAEQNWKQEHGSLGRWMSRF